MASSKVIKAKKVNQNKKEPVWPKILRYLRTLLKNDACIDVGSSTKWYWTILLFIFSIGFAMLPVAINTVSTNGSSYIDLTGYSDAYSLGLKSYLNDVDAADIIFSTTDDGINANISGSNDGEAFYVYKKSIDDGTSTVSDLLLTLYYTDTTGDNYNNILDVILETDVDGYGRDSSFILFGKENFYLRSYSSASTTYYSLTCDYDYFGDFLEDGETSFSLREYLSQATEDYAALSQNAIFENLCNLVDNGYINNRNKVCGLYIGISVAVDGCLVLLMGLVYFLMTRGKSNPNKHYKWYQFLGVSTWSSLTPSIITLILGFFLSSGYEMMVFIFAFGCRSIFLSMRQLRPPVD